MYNAANLKSLIFFLALILFSCTSTSKDEKDKTNDELTFGCLVDMEELDKVKMSNNSGTFNLSEKQVKKIKDELSQMTYEPDISVKVGAISIELIINGEKFNWIT